MWNDFRFYTWKNQTLKNIYILLKKNYLFFKNLIKVNVLWIFVYMF